MTYFWFLRVGCCFRVYASCSLHSVKMVQETDWQLKRSSLVARNSFMFNNELISDVNFVVYSQKSACKVFIPAHKYVLAISSPVFLAMFYSNLAVAGNTVDLPDCDSEGLLEFLRFIYCDTVELTLPSAIQALYLAKKYLLPSLAKICVSFIKENVTAIHALEVLPYAVKLDEQELAQKCLEVIDINADIALTSHSFLDVNDDLLEIILKRDSLCVKEIDLFKAVQLWLSHNYMPHSMSRTSSRKSKPILSADKNSETPTKRVYSGTYACRCQEHCDCVTGLSPSSLDASQSGFKIPKSHAMRDASESTRPIALCDQNQNQLIISSSTVSFARLCSVTNRLLRNIRFPLMSEEDFKQHVVPSNLLSHQDIVDLLASFGPVPSKLEKYSSTSRKATLMRCPRFSVVSRWFLYSGSQSESVIMSVNTPIKLHGIRIYGHENCHYRIKLNVYPRENPSEMRTKEACYKSETRGNDGYHGYDTVFDQPFRIENDTDYIIEAVIAGPPSAYGKEAHRTIEFGKVRFEFKGEENSIFQNFGVGQFSEIIFFEL